MPGTIKIAIVDDEHLIRKGISLLLEKENNFQVVYEAESGERLLSYLEEAGRHPDIILLDIRMEGVNGIDVTKIISEQFPDIKIIILSSLKSDQMVRQMVYYGISAYLAKNSHPTEMIATINQVHQNGICFDSRVMKIVIDVNRTGRRSRKKFFTLSDREIEILNLICMQLSTSEIAEKLYLSERTVEGHRKRMLEKTESKNMVGLIVWGIRNQVLLID